MLAAIFYCLIRARSKVPAPVGLVLPVEEASIIGRGRDPGFAMSVSFGTP